MTNDVKLLQAALAEVQALIDDSFGVFGVRSCSSARISWEDLLFNDGKGLGRLQKFCEALEAPDSPEPLTAPAPGGTITG